MSPTTIPGNLILQSPTANDPLLDLNTQPSLDLQFATSKTLDDRVSGQNLITFSRSTTGTYVDSNGIIQTAAIDAPRFDHDPSTGESLGLLIEESRSNIHSFSNIFSNSGAGGSNPKWQDFVNVTLQEQQYPDPAGGNTATRIIPSSTLGIHYIGRYSTYSAGTTYTYSIFVKPQGYSKFSISMNGTGPTVDLSANPPLFTGGTSSRYGNKIEKFPNNWYRVSFTWVNSGGGGANTSQPRITILDNTGSATFSGDGTSGIDVYGFQAEIGAFPTSYIPTSGSAVTRAADVASITGTNFSSWYNQSEGTVFSASTVSSNSGFTYTINDGSNFNRHGFNSGTSSGQPFVVISDIGTIFGTAPTVVAGGGLVSYAYKANDYGVYGNGTSLNATSPATVPVGLTELAIGFRGSYQADTFINGHIKRLAYYPYRLPDATLQEITS